MMGLSVNFEVFVINFVHLSMFPVFTQRSQETIKMLSLKNVFNLEVMHHINIHY